MRRRRANELRDSRQVTISEEGAIKAKRSWPRILGRANSSGAVRATLLFSSCLWIYWRYKHCVCLSHPPSPLSHWQLLSPASPGAQFAQVARLPGCQVRHRVQVPPPTRVESTWYFPDSKRKKPNGARHPKWDAIGAWTHFYTSEVMFARVDKTRQLWKPLTR